MKNPPPPPSFSTGAGDCHWRWAHFIHNFKNWLLNWCQPIKVSVLFRSWEDTVDWHWYRGSNFLLGTLKVFACSITWCRIWNVWSSVSLGYTSRSSQSKCGFFTFYWLYLMFLLLYFHICTFTFGGTVFSFFIFNKGWKKFSNLDVLKFVFV